jgi:arylsulfotransferase ASST
MKEGPALPKTRESIALLAFVGQLGYNHGRFAGAQGVGWRCCRACGPERVDPMTRFTRLLALTLVTALLCLRHAPAIADAPSYEFISPIPGSAMVLPETNIILRPGGIVDGASVGGPLVTVSGSISGAHGGQLRLSDDRQTLTFQPSAPFAYGETVMCQVGSGLATDTRGVIPPASFTFTVAGPERETLGDVPFLADDGEIPPPPPAVGPTREIGLSATLAADSLPPDFPIIRSAVYGKTAPGRLFVTDFRLGVPVSSYLMILENDGTPFFHRQVRGPSLDFKMQPDGRLTYFDSAAGRFYALNARYDVVDSFTCGNGYSTDAHDLALLPNGHAVLMSYDRQIMDLSQVVPGGRIDARVIGLIIQELDRDKNVVFQWRSWDHFQITDVVSHDLTAKTVDYVHGNSIDVDPDGNLILSSRHMNEITKISRATGDILWRLGGRNNQFTFINEPIAFSHQHCARRLPNGHITLFDNGNFRTPEFSRAVEYAIDEVQKTATLVWQYRLNPDVFTVAAGSVQRLSNGNTLIGWGTSMPTLTEVAPDGSLVSELSFESGIGSYRAFRFEWPPVKPATVAMNPGTLNMDSNGGSISAQIRPEAASFSIVDVKPSTVRFNGTVPAESVLVLYGGAKMDSIVGLKAKFARDRVVPLLAIGLNRVEVSGSLQTGEIFRGSSEVRLLPSDKAKVLVGTLRAVSAPGAIPVVLAVGGPGGAGTQARTFAVYDVQGRLVTRWRTTVGAGGIVTWNGRASDGRRVSSGIYLVRREDLSNGSALKVVIAR